MRGALAVAVFIAVLTALTYFVFPGHTYLQQDTQIYLPMLEKLDDPSLFANELLTSRPHLAWTLYDEVAVALRRATGLGFAPILIAQQIVFRALGIWGVYLIGTSLGFSRRLGMFIAALFSLGATIVGPAVLTIEYEPVPRGFAIPLTLCAIGLSLHRRWIAAALCGSIALLYHAPTTAPFWVVFAMVSWKARVWKPWLLVLFASATLLVFSRLQPGIVQRQPLFSTISPALEQLQKLRASYNWVSLWPREIFIHYGILTLACAVAMWRLRDRLSMAHRIVFWGLLATALVSLPFSYLTLEGLRWSLIPQFQPARAVLFITALSVILASAAGLQAAYEHRYQETFAWFLIPFIIPVHKLITPPYALTEVFLIALLAASASAAVAVHVWTPRRAAPALAMAALVSFFAVPLVGGVRNYPALWNPSILELARWARTSSDKAAVFAFPQAGKDLHPGIFRAEARRAVYVDWKGGGQVNYFEDLALEWWNRWRDTMLNNAPAADLAARGVDYIVLDSAKTQPPAQAVYRNAGYAVYRLK